MIYETRMTRETTLVDSELPTPLRPERYENRMAVDPQVWRCVGFSTYTEKCREPGHEDEEYVSFVWVWERELKK
jgi:hypothetical protein